MHSNSSHTTALQGTPVIILQVRELEADNGLLKEVMTEVKFDQDFVFLRSHA